MFRILICDGFIQICIMRLNDRARKEIIDTLNDLNCEYTVDTNYVVVKDPTFKLLEELCCFSDILLM